ncbi:hypothetical protein PM082_000391 [Marasmius tenuissimus]|nr:hypothetical protein PM082_000391 [Marasmius tenuissimus]
MTEGSGMTDQDRAARAVQGLGAGAAPHGNNRPGMPRRRSEDSVGQGDRDGGSRDLEEEIEVLRERIRVLEAGNRNPLLAVSEEIERARERAKASAEAAKNKPLAKPVDGYKANPLLAPVSDRISEAVRQNKYVPLSAIVAQSKHFTLRTEEDELVLTKDGNLKARPLDRKGETNLEFQEHQNAAKALVKSTRQHHGDIRADKLSDHFAIVSSLAQSHGLKIAYAYDIQQRELSAGDERHDLAILDSDALTLLTTAALTSGTGGHQLRTPSGPSAPGKRRFSSMTAENSTSAKRHNSSCFRCGGSGHIAPECTATTTKAGMQCLRVQKFGNRNSLVSESGKQLCFRWSIQSQCRFGSNCNHTHSCSICGGADHGAAACSQL